MKQKKPETIRKKAFTLALGTFIFLFSGVVGLAIFYDFSSVDLDGLLFLVSFLCCLFIAKNLFDLTVLGEVRQGDGIGVTGQGGTSLYSQLYQKSPVPYFLISDTGSITSANTAAARLLGFQQQRLIGMNIFSLLRTEAEDHKDMLVEKYSSGIGVSNELVSLKRPDHKEIWALLSVFTLQTKYAEKQGLLTLVDITKQKKAEDAKSEFVSLASHQLRTPIAGMKWSAELLQMDNPENLTERQHKYLNRLIASISRMSILVDDFLRVSRFELGSFRPEYQSVVLKVLFTDVLSELKETALHKKITTHVQFDPAVGEIESDPNLLRMILTNLYSNAVKYTPAEGTISVAFKREGHILYIQVRDTGMGIPVDDQEQIFSKLFRASNATRDVPDGTGLGLYIVREAISVLRGNISFESTEGQGTTFDIKLPYKEPEHVDTTA